MHHSDHEKYRAYQATDFALDLSFQRWAQGGNSPFWDYFQQAYPEKEEVLREATALIQRWSVRHPPLSSEYLEAQLAAVYTTIDRRASPLRGHRPPVAPPWYRTPLFRYAASSVGLLLVGALFYLYRTTADRVYQTAYQETRTIRLDDGTEVVLNTNSRLRVAPDLATATVREVWLDGEAFFTVNPSVSSGQPRSFIVRTARLEVAVLGTVFNVKSRPEGTQVLLREGSVQVARPETQERLLMTPGEVVEAAATDQSLRKKTSEPGALAWRQNVFDFRDAPLATVARQIYDCYGKKVQFDDPMMADYRFTARLSRDDLPLLLSLIEGAFPVRIITKQNTLILTKP